jgi:aspartyl-tRNA(Asn)/glutamyl-tRNA(Gln) amidotransferase subunit A
VKDLVDIAGFPTRRGSRLSDPAPVAEDAPSVVGLKAAGAVIIGKTTTTEYGWKTPGDCPLHGITRNPWNTDHTTGGSSSGAGAAGAACFGALHIGTDAGGSVRLPAAWCGLVGLKPTYGRIPQWPAGAFASVACAGPMTRSVRDAALMLSAIARHDARDPYCLPDDARDWRDGIEDGVAGMTVGVLRRPGFDAPIDEDGVKAVERAAAILQDAGAIVDEATPELPDTRTAFGRTWGAALARLVGTFGENERGLLDQGLLEVAKSQGGMSAIAFMDAEAMRAAAGHAMAMLHQRFDLVLCPTVPGPPPLADAPTVDPVQALWKDWAPWTFTFNLTRQPAITVPMGLSGAGLPLSVQIAAAQFRDDLVLRGARAIEHAAPFPVARLG